MKSSGGPWVPPAGASSCVVMDVNVPLYLPCNCCSDTLGRALPPGCVRSFPERRPPAYPPVALPGLRRNPLSRVRHLSARHVFLSAPTS